MSASIKTAGDFGALGGDVPEIPAYFAGDTIASARVFGGDLYSGTWPYHGDKKEAFQMQTYAIEMGHSTPEDRNFPINPHVVELDAHEPRADNEGVFELGLPSPLMKMDGMKLGPEPALEAVLDTSTEPKPDATPELQEPAVEKSKGDLSTLPSQRRGTSWLKAQNDPSDYEDNIWKNDLRLEELFKTDAEEQKPISNEKEPFRMEIDEKIFHLEPSDASEEKGLIPDLSSEIANAAIVSSALTSAASFSSRVNEAGQSVEKDRGRPPIQAISTVSVSSSSIPMSQFSSSSSPSRMLHILNEDMMSSSGRAIQRARSEARKAAGSKADGMEGTEGSTSRPVSRGKAHISSMVVDTKVLTRPRKKSTSSLKSVKSLKSLAETEDADFQNLLRVLELKPDGLDPGPKSPIEMP
jgi:hypothetical protein